jgi:YfiH family protein
MIQKYGVSALQTKDDLEFFRAPHIEATERLVHAFSTRRAGVSPPPFHSLNLSFKIGDRESRVEENREILARAFGLSSSGLFTVNQVHGDRVFIVDFPRGADFSRPSCDAIITDRPGIAIGVLTADCVPILLFDPDHRAAAAIHVGWKGTSRDLPGKTVRTMIDRFNTQPETLRAAVGPSIGPCCYEVDDRVYVAFSHRHDRWSRWAQVVSSGSWMLNLPQANIDLLVESGVLQENIELLDICTHCERDLFYSHRRDNGTTGRQIAFIMLKP